MEKSLFGNCKVGLVLLSILLLIATSTQVLAFDNCETGVPLKSSSLSTSNVAVKNAGETVLVTSGGTLDEYLCTGETIYFDMYVHTNDSEITSAVLTLSVWDVDEYCDYETCEVDNVYFNGHYLGKLTGADDTWSTVTFVLDPSWVNGAVNGQPGVNHVVVDIDVLDGGWCVEVDWGQLIINGGASGNAEIVSLTTDKEEYKPGDTINVDVGMTTDEQSQTVVLETNLFDPYGMNVYGMSGDATLSSGTVKHVTRQLQIPDDAKSGTYTVEAIVYDKNTGLRQDSATTHVEVVAEPDFYVRNSDIEFTSVTKLSTSAKASGYSVNVRAKVHYEGGTDPVTVKVDFYDVDLSTGAETKISSQNVNLNPGTNYVYVTWNPADTDHVIRVIVDPDNAVKESDETNNVASKRMEGPEIVSVKSKYRGYFLPGVSVMNTYYVETSGNVAKVEFDMDGNVKVDTNGNDGWSADFDMGQLSHNSVLKITAYSPSGVPSETYVVKPAIVDIPSWLEEFIILSHAATIHFTLWSLTHLAHDNVFAYQYEKSLPDPPIEATISIPSWIPVINGKYGLELQILYGFEFKSDGSATGYGGGGIGVSVAGREGKISPKLSATVGVENGNPPKIKLTGADATLDGTIEFPAFQFHLKIWKLDLGKITIKLIPGVEGTLHFKEDNTGTGFFPGLAWDSSTGKLKTALEGVGRVGKSTRGIEVAVGGEPSMTFGVPSPYFRNVAVKVYVKGTFSMFGYQKSKQASYEWSYPPSGVSSKRVSITATEWEPVPRNYGSAYAVFKGAKTLAASASGSSVGMGESVLVENLYHYAYPWVATDGQHALLVWTHDDVSKPEVIGQEIYYSLWDGSQWSSPAAITDNYLIDWQPRVAYDGSGNAVAVWQLVDDPTVTSSTDPDTFLDSVELAYSVYNASTGTWSAVNKLTDNSVYDGMHSLTTDQNGGVVLAWVEDTDNNVTTIYGRNVKVALWNGSGWSVWTVARNVSVDDNPVAIASNSFFVCVWAQDMDGNATTTSDRELYYSVLTRNGWSAPQRITFDNYEDASPSLGYTAGGDIVLAWVTRDAFERGNESWDLLYTSRFDGSWSTPDLATESPSIYEDRLVVDQNGNLILVWQGTSETGQDLMYSVYDGANGHWSDARQLTNDEPAEWQVSAGLLSGGDVIVTYMKRDISFFNGIPIDGASDLYYLIHPVGYDVAVTNVTLSNPKPSIGQTVQISAKIDNIGDLGVDNVGVAFYVNNNLVATKSVAHIDSTESATVSASWTVNSQNFDVRVVADYSNAINEVNESNNEYTASFSLQDYSVKSVGYRYTSNGIEIVAEICNNGSIAGNVNVVLLNANDAILHSEYVSPQPGSCVEEEWQVSLRNLTDFMRVVVDAGNQIDEMNKSNNCAAINMTEYPDLVLLPEWVTTGYGSGVVNVNATVCNYGTSSANLVFVYLYENATCGYTGTQLASTFINSLNAGECRNISLSWAAGTGSHDIVLFAQSSNTDLDMSNNVACLHVLVPALPDLSITQGDVSISENASGYLVFDVKVRNTGSMDANLVSVEVYNSSINYVSPNPYITINPNKIAEVVVPKIAAGSYVDLTIPTNLIAKSGKKYTFYVTVDRENAVNESNENNNVVELMYGGAMADVNGDGKVNFNDLIAVLNAILSGSNDPKYDVNNDNKVNFNDLIAVLNAILSGS